MSYRIQYLPEAVKDFKRLDGSQRLIVRKAIEKVSLNPVSVYQGGYDHPLGNHNDSNLAGFYKIKLRASGLRIVYQLIQQDDEILIVIIGAQDDNEVYQQAEQRIKKHSEAFN